MTDTAQPSATVTIRNGHAATAEDRLADLERRVDALTYLIGDLTTKVGRLMPYNDPAWHRDPEYPQVFEGYDSATVACHNCGRNVEVPFLRGGKAPAPGSVLCSDCYDKGIAKTGQYDEVGS